MFIELPQQLGRHGIKISHKRLSKEIILYIKNNNIVALNGDGNSLVDFMHNHNSIESYVEQMSHDGEWEDRIILLAFANLYESDLYIISLISESPLILQPTNGHAHMSVTLGHIHKVHYVTLGPLHQECTCENEMQQGLDFLCHACGQIIL